MTKEAVKTAITYYYLDIVTDEENRVMWDALHSINPIYHRLLTLRYNDGCSWGEVARALHSNTGSVRRWHNRALEILGEVLEESSGIYEDVAHC